MPGRRLTGRFGASRALALVCLMVLAQGCSIRELAIRKAADVLTESGSAFVADDDPELVRDALPFALKTIEGLLAEVPDHRGLRLAACQGFVQYGFAFVELEADRLAFDDYFESARLKKRAAKLYLRGRDHCLEALNVLDPGVAERLRRSPETALGDAVDRDLELVYWSGASWGAAIALALDRPEMVVDLGAVRVLLERVLARAPDFGKGQLHETMISLESVPEAMGGSREKARTHYEAALALSGGTRVTPHVTYARKVAVAAQDRKLFLALLDKALAIDAEQPSDERLINLIGQAHAQIFKAQVDDLFFAEDEEDPASGE